MNKNGLIQHGDRPRSSTTTAHSPMLALILVASFPIAACFFIIPFELYYPQRTLWGGVIELPLAFVGVGVCLLGALSVFMFLMRRILPTFLEYFALCCFWLGLYLLVADVFAPLQCSSLDGWAPVSTEPRNLTIRELLFALLVTTLSLRLKKELALDLARSAAMFVWLLALSYLSLVILTPRTSLSHPHKVTEAELPNVYHLVLDELQTDAAITALRDSKVDQELDGFTIFPFNSSSYLFTKASFPNYMTGTTFHGNEPFPHWLEAYKRSGILKSLAERGYEVNMFAPWAIWDNEYASSFSTIDEMTREHLNMPLLGMADFFPVWLARVAPNPLANEALVWGATLERQISVWFGVSSRWPRTISQGREPFASVHTWRAVIAREASQSAHSRYTYAHGIIPHGPYVIDARCEFSRTLPAQKVSSYYAQTLCGVRLISEFLTELKRLGRYDQSLIVVHADTGHGLRGFVRAENNRVVSTELKMLEQHPKNLAARYPNWTEGQILARTLSFLMIKPPQAHGPVKLSALHSKLLDLFPTIMDLLGIPLDSSSSEGSSLFGPVPPEATRQNVYFFYDPRDSEPTIETRTWDPVAVGQELAFIHKTP